MAQPPSKIQSGKTQSGEKEAAPPARRNWVDSVGRDLGIAGAAAFARAGFADPTLVLHWQEIAGADVARITRPVRFAPREGTLTLLAEPAAALFLSHESRALATRINTYLGRNAVWRIKFVQGRLTMKGGFPTPPRPAESLNSSDPSNAYKGPGNLKAALQSLARWRESGRSQSR